MDEMRNARRVMVDNQIRTFDVTDPNVLAAFESVPRQLFVAPADSAIAYSDRPLSVGSGSGLRHLLPPLVLARLLQALEAQKGELALDVLGGSGYSAALLATMGLETTILETDDAAIDLARKTLAEAGIAVSFLPDVTGVMAGAKAAMPTNRFHCILVNGAVEIEPVALFPLLRDGGRLAVILRQNGVSRAMLYVKSSGAISRRRIFDAQAAILPGFAKDPAFVF
jgi:protein-L-isoaspartate(D-aspartate) O-methyltransferase